LFNASGRLVLRSRNVLAKRAGALRVIIGGHLANNAPNLEKGIHDQQPIAPGTTVPDLKAGKAGARDIAPFIDRRSKSGDRAGWAAGSPF
jgi:hypothetical protein